jgi:methyltransferase (TIGR00027 family)
MQPGQPSLTARRAAAHRALHQDLEGGRIFADPFAGRMLGVSPAAVFGDAADPPRRRAMRLLIAARSRIAEDALAAAVARGVRQYVILGAGLDTFACRNPHAGLTVFEVDHPATQAWKRGRLAEAALSAAVTFAPVDFERETLAQGLARAGFDAASPAFFSWLGVVPYLTREAVLATLGDIAGRPGAEVVFDHGEPVSSYPPEQQAAAAARGDGAAALGEPWITFFTPGEIAAELTSLGFTEIEDFGPGVLAERYFGAPRHDRPGGHIVRARRE